MRSIGALAVIAALSLAAPAPINAAPADSAAWLDADAPVVISMYPTFLEKASAIAADSLGKQLPDLRRALTLISAGSVGAMGFDVLSTKGWAKAGFDASEPMLISAGAIDDAGSKKVYDKLFAFKKWTDKKLRSVTKAYWRSRVVLRVADAGKAKKTIARVARTAPDLFVVNKRNAADIAMLVGERPRKSRKLIVRLRRSKVLAIGWLPGIDSYLVFRWVARRRFLLIDVVGSFAGVPMVWPRDRKKFLKVLQRTPGDSKLANRLSRGGPTVLGSDLAVWIQPGALLDAAKATGRHRALQALASGSFTKKRARALYRATSAEIARCDDFRPFATKGPFVDVAISLDLDKRGITGRTRWRLRSGYKLGAAMVKADDGVVQWGKPSDAIVVAAHYLDSLGRLRALPRPKLLRGGFANLAESSYRCGSGGALIAGLFGWPQIAGLALDEIRATEPTIATIVDGARNGVVAVKQIGGAETDWVVAAAGSFNKSAARAINKLIESVAGAGKRVRLAGRRITTWKIEIMRVFGFLSARGEACFGVALGRGASKWLLGGVGASKAPPIARWTVDVPAVFAQLAVFDPDNKRTYTALGHKLSRVDGTLDLDGNSLAAVMKLSFR